MKNVLVEITEHDIELFKALVYSNNDDESFEWIMPMEDQDENIKIHFRKEIREEQDEQ